MKKWCSVLAGFLLGLPLASAIDSQFRFGEFTKVIASFFHNLDSLSRLPEVKYGVAFIGMGLLLYGIYAGALKKVKIFEGEGGIGINTSGKLVCTGIMLLSLFGIFSFRTNIMDVVDDILPSFGLLGAGGICLVVFIMVFRGFKDTEIVGFKNWQIALIATGIMMIFFSRLT